MADKIKTDALLSTGFPWRALVIALVILAGGVASGIGLGYPVRAVLVISILSALALFSALVGWGPQSRR